VFPVDLLVAAHIKRRSLCSETERRDLHNVAMLACKFGCDALFEEGYWLVSECFDTSSRTDSCRCDAARNDPGTVWIVDCGL
jgi:hypothetical protein